ncbi:MAG: BON domain-containing protein [Steroidobacteraceae bacterium]
MNRRDNSPGEFHPGNPGFQESHPDQYGQEHYEHRYYSPSRQGQHAQGEHGEREHGQREYGQREYGQREYGQREYGQREYEQGPYGGAQQRPRQYGLGQYRESQPRYFGAGSQGYGGGPSFTGGTYGYADERSDAPYFQEVGFNRGYYEDPLGRASFPQDWSQRESYPRQSFRPSREGRTQWAAPQTRRRYPTGPKGYKRSDERLQEDISERLMQAYDIDSSDVTVQVQGARVVLEGTVPDRYMKHAIEDLADAAPGVEDVENRIRVARDSTRDSRDTAQPLGSRSGGADAGSLGNAAMGSGAAGNTPKSTRRDS